MKKKRQQTRENRKLAHLNNDGDFFFFGLGDKGVFVSLRGAGGSWQLSERNLFVMALGSRAGKW